MIIFRYLSKEILISTFAVCFSLLLIVLSLRFANLLAEATAGKYAVNVLFEMIGYRMPGFVPIILPFGFYLAILLAYGRLYMESEMVVLFAGGLSHRQLLAITMGPACLIALLVAVFTFWVAPSGIRNYAKILDEQRNRSEFDMLNSGRFQSLSQGQTITYVEEITNDHKNLNDVFIARDSGSKTSPTILLAREGTQIEHPEYGQRYLVLNDGYQYEGQPGTADFRITHFSSYGQYMPPVVLSGDYTNEFDAKTTAELWASDEIAQRTTFQWRLSLPLMVFVIAILAVPFSKTNPRQGRYLKMLPAFLVFVFYFVFLTTVRELMAQGKWPLFPGFWVVHGAFAALGWLLFNWDRLTLPKRRPVQEITTHA
ncbi:LPS export ABC transporter permease LptF [Cellvibrio zantedeschiae]|uniref:Lipopolysaccharide export system permease protein LptF n=1 Tax=Cellvibrio zantedeschiae TaxID=1237077 RepID=A0ABQ3AX61_9GAMM|nr:LPS export ABC transporter permease LptF [Cellvibrio zantedeschiae]GGY69046.1 LPS export ABC transporter permease LptF [Cellvibrio zantedeschiae]